MSAPNTPSRSPAASAHAFYDWQLVQSTDESWRDCHLHARNLLGDQEYERLVESLRRGVAHIGQSPKAARTHGSARVPVTERNTTELLDRGKAGR